MSYHDIEYSPLTVGPRRKSRCPLWLWVLLGGSIFLALNVFVSKRMATQSLSPLDRFEKLNDISPVYEGLQDVSGNPELLAADERAVVSTLYTENYIPGLLALGQSLREANTSARSVLLYFPKSVSPKSRCQLEAVGWELHPISRIEAPDGGKGVYSRFLDQYSKLNIWGLDTIGIKVAIYLDGDTVVRSNFDELWSLPFNFAAVPDIYGDKRGFTLGFNAGVLFLRTSSTIRADMLSKIGTAHYKHTDAEQGFLNTYFSSQVSRLPYTYNANLAIKKRAPEFWEAMKNSMKIVHYTLVKPWEVLNYRTKDSVTSAEEWKEEFGWWSDAWRGASATVSRAECEALPLMSLGD